MTRRWLASCLALGLLVAAPAPVRAEVTIADWAVSSKPDTDGDCTATKEYTDAEDGKSSKAVVLFVVGKTDALSAIIVSMGYSGWHSAKGTMTADLRIDGEVVAPGATWQIDGTTAAASFPAVVPVARALGRGAVLELAVGDGRPVRFDIAGAGRALGAVQYCQQKE